MSDGGTDGRRGPRPRIDALCCTCGERRTVATPYRGRKPSSSTLADDDMPPSCRWLRCSHCSTVTAHAVMGIRTPSQRHGCDREQHNRETDALRRRVERRLAGFTAAGITLVRDVPPEQMHLENALLEVIDVGGQRQVRIARWASPARLLTGMNAVDDILDDPAPFGTLTDPNRPHWHGVALRV